MYDLELVAQLHALQTDPAASPEQQQEARDKVSAISDSVVEQYLSTLLWDSDGGAFLGQRRGTRKFESYEVLWARNCLEGRYVYGHGGIDECPPVEDKVGNVLFHRRYTQRSE